MGKSFRAASQRCRVATRGNTEEMRTTEAPMGNAKGSLSNAKSYSAKRELLKLSWNIILSLDQKEGVLNTQSARERKPVRDRSRRSVGCTHYRMDSLQSITSVSSQEDRFGSGRWRETKSSLKTSNKISPQASPHVSPRALAMRKVSNFVESPRKCKVSNASVFQIEFKECLFRLCPDLSNRFPASFALVVTMLKSFIKKVINGSCTPGLVDSFVKSHVTYKLKKEHFDGFGEAIASTVTNLLGPFGTFELCKIWREETSVMVEMLYKNYAAFLERTSKTPSSINSKTRESDLGSSYMHISAF
ncbi:hypothetical protein AAMO2058_001090400 [Amorphochlora amoebiformis]